jgi:hypothetical protein
MYWKLAALVLGKGVLQKRKVKQRLIAMDTKWKCQEINICLIIIEHAFSGFNDFKRQDN